MYIVDPSPVPCGAIPAINQSMLIALVTRAMQAATALYKKTACPLTWFPAGTD